MNDTTAEAASWLRVKYAQRTPLERLRMATGMFEDAKSLVRARILRDTAARTASEVRAEIVRTLYASDLAPAVLAGAVERVRLMDEASKTRP
jgi:hypothetical protein